MKNKLHLLFSCLFTGLLGNAQVPEINSFVPSAGSVGTVVTITGTNFSTTAADNIVYFGAVKSSVSAATSTSLTVTVPPGARYSPISVTVNSLTAYSAAPFSLTFENGPFTTKSFIQKMNTYVQSQSDNVFIQDLDGDGKPDAISADDSLIILRNTSSTNNISFARAGAFVKVGVYNIKVNSGDFDGDGKPDIALVTSVSFNSYNLSILKNTSTVGNFSFTKFDFPVTGASNLLVADIDKDGKPDVVVNGCRVFRNTTVNGIITFANPVQFAFNSSYNISAADLDADGKIDMVTANGSGNNLLLLRNLSTPGTISFAAAVTINVGGYPKYTAISDIDADGMPDIVVQNNASNNSFSIFKNASTIGTFSFPSRTNYGSALGGLKFSITDLDGDGKPDIASVNGVDENTVSIFKNISSPGNISLANPVDNWSEYNMLDIDICDIDGDGKPDIGMTNQSFTVLRNSVAEPIVFSFAPLKANAGSTITIRGYSFTTTTAVNFNGLPAPSFSIISDTVITAVIPANLDGNVSITNAAGTGSLNENYPVPQITVFIPASGAAGDVITIKGQNFNPASNQNIVYFGSVKASVNAGTDSTLLVTVPKGAISERISLTTHHLTAYSAKPFTITFLNGDASFTASSFEPPLNFATYATPISLVINDLNGDGKPDLAVSEYYFSTLLKNSSDSAAISFTKAHDSSSQYEYPMGDINGDGKFDKVVSAGGPPVVTVGVFRNKSTNDKLLFDRGMQVVNTAPFASANFHSRPAIDDLNGDGKPEVITGNNNDNNNGTLLILQNQSTDSRDSIISFVRKPGFTAASGAYLVRTADLDGDNLPDIITLHFNAGYAFSVFRNNGAGENISLATFQPFGNVYGAANATKFVVSDIDGDGKEDIVLLVPSTQTMAMFRNTSVTGNISFAAPSIYPITATPKGLAIGDLNGDNKPDLVLTTSADSMSVYRNISVAGSFSFAPRVNYKTSSSPEFVAIGDIDTDGIPDIVVLNSGAGTVSIFRNHQGQIQKTALCNPVGNTTLAAAVAGTTFQWQLSTDAVNFNNISDNTYYAGTNTSTLVLSNIPSGWYGYQYRCVTDGNNIRTFSLQFVNTWTGAADNNWENPLNWSCATIPDANTDVFINTGSVLLNNSTTIRSLKMQPGVILTVHPGVILTITH
jgi:hypothetical protein